MERLIFTVFLIFYFRTPSKKPMIRTVWAPLRGANFFYFPYPQRKSMIRTVWAPLRGAKMDIPPPPSPSLDPLAEQLAIPVAVCLRRTL